MASAEFDQTKQTASRNERASVWVARAPRIAEWILLGLMAYLLAKIAINIFAPLPLPKGDRLAAATGGALSANDSQAVALNPFPQTDAAAPLVEPTANMQETTLDLSLKGVWPSAQNPSAIIQLPDTKQRRFAVGDEIVSGVSLTSVAADHVVIEQNGVREVLRFENKAPYEQLAPIQDEAAPASANDITQPSEKISNLPSGDMLGGLVRLGLGADSEGAQAVMMFAGRNRAAFENAGLRDGDIVRAVNGAEPSTNPIQMATILSDVAKAGSASITIERDGVEKTIILSLSQSGIE